MFYVVMKQYGFDTLFAVIEPGYWYETLIAIDDKLSAIGYTRQREFDLSREMGGPYAEWRRRHMEFIAVLGCTEDELPEYLREQFHILPVDA